MAKNDIGGFFVSLGLNPDKNSFEQGQKLIDNVAVSLHKIIGAARNASVVLAGTAVATGVVESANYKTATAIGIATDSLDLWRASAKIAGVNADGLVGSMGKLANVVNRIKIDGAGLNEFSKQLGELGIITDDINMEEMLNMAPDELMEEIIRKAQEASAKVKQSMTEAREALAANPNDKEAQTKLTEGQKENQRIITIVGDILGSEGQNFFIELERQGKGIEEFLAQAQKTILTDDEDRQKGADFAVELNTFKATAESLGKFVGDEVAGLLTDPLKEVNEWLQGNGDVIKQKISDVAQTTEKIIGKSIEKIGEFWDKNGDSIKSNISKIASTTEKIVGDSIKVLGDWWSAHGDELLGAIQNIGEGVALVVTKLVAIAGSETGKTAVKSWFKSVKGAVKTTANVAEDLWYGNWEKAFYDYLEGFEESIVEPSKDLWEAITGKGKSDNSVKDGIVRPDGTVTQVAPDDWVFAVRNITDLTDALAPQQSNQVVQSAPAEKKNTPQKAAEAIAPQQNIQVIQQAPAEKKSTPQKDAEAIAPRQNIQITQQTEAPQRETLGPQTEPAPQKEIQIIQPAEAPQREKPPIVPAAEPQKEMQIIQQDPEIIVAPNTQLEDMGRIVSDMVGQIVRAISKPQAAAMNTNQEYTINQTFNIQGGTNDMPVVLKQQAYRGTQDALMQAMEQSSRRMQMMSGTR